MKENDTERDGGFFEKLLDAFFLRNYQPLYFSGGKTVTKCTLTESYFEQQASRLMAETMSKIHFFKNKTPYFGWCCF